MQGWHSRNILIDKDLVGIDNHHRRHQNAVLEAFWAFEPGLRRGFLLGLSPHPHR